MESCVAGLCPTVGEVLRLVCYLVHGVAQKTMVMLITKMYTAARANSIRLSISKQSDAQSCLSCSPTHVS